MKKDAIIVRKVSDSMQYFQNNRLKMMAGIYEEFDRGELNEGLTGFKKHLSQDEINAIQILFDYFYAFMEHCEKEGIVLDATYATLYNLPDALQSFYTKQAHKYLPSKLHDILARTLASYLMILASNVHQLDISFHKNEGGLWANMYTISVNDIDLLESALNVFNDNQWHFEALSNDYKKLSNVNLIDYLTQA